MADHNIKSTVSQRLAQVKDIITGQRTQDPNSLPWDPNCTKFPTRAELPAIEGHPKGSAWVWGKDDYVGRVNLLTPTRVAAAAKYIKTGEIVPVNLPLNVPDPPGFFREPFKHEIKTLRKDEAYDDLYTMNTQSGTQWDGFRHVAHHPTKLFYNNTRASSFASTSACSIHHLSTHGIAGRALLLDYAAYASAHAKQYDAYSTHAISLAELHSCAEWQGVDIRPASRGGDVHVGDILLVRVGWVAQYNSTPPEERARLAARRHDDGSGGQCFAGLQQSEEMLDWLHDCYFAAVAGDAPAFEAWPSPVKWQLHEHILALWGMPLGEMLDLEVLAKKCRGEGRWFCFFTSAVANCVGGVGSHVNGMVIL